MVKKSGMYKNIAVETFEKILHFIYIDELAADERCNMEINCEYVQQSEHFSYYKISNCPIPDKIYHFRVTHPPGNSNEDVKYLNIVNCDIKKIPQGFTNIFPNLEILEIEDTKLEKVNKNDLMEYKNLKEFYCDRHLLEYLGGNLFEDFKNLEKLSFVGKNIKVIEPTILDGLNKLTYVHFSNNDNYNCCFSIEDDSETLDDFKQELFETFCSNSENVKKFIKKFQNKIKKLSVSNIKHVTKSQNLEEINRKLRIINQDYSASSIQGAIELGSLRSQIKQFEDREKFLTQEIQKLKLGSNQHKSGFSADIKKLTKNDNFKDFSIQIDDQLFTVHKFLLAARSPTLAEIFLKNPEAENLKLVDISVETFEIILHFLYTDELPNDNKGANIIQLYSAAGRLEISELRTIVAKRVLGKISPENATEAYILSNKFNNPELRQKAFAEIKKMYPDLSDNWIDKPDKVKKFIEVFGEN